MNHDFHRLDTAGQTMVWVSTAGALPRLLYWGEALSADANLAMLAEAQRPALPHGGLDVDETLSWLPQPGQGFTDMPGLELRRGARTLYTRFVSRGAERRGDGWVFDYDDGDNALGLRLALGVDAASGVFSADVTLFNRGSEALAVDRLVSLALPLPAKHQVRIAFAGRWAGEFDLAREPFSSAGWLQEARVGRTSHHAFPGVIVAEAETDATRGEAWAVQLAWSGNHRLLLQRTRHGAYQLQAGELLLPGEVVLAPGEHHRTPTLHLARSAQGLRGLALRWHRFARARVLPALAGPRPVQFSTWEATFFDHDEARQKQLAQAAAEVGAERFVLDDGWFVGRRHDRAGLGDWTPCPERYPRGLRPLAEHCLALGMQFGLWVEPEGVNADSALFRSHPDWIIGPRDQPVGRHQYTLNFGLPAVRENLLAQLMRLLESAPIGFLKWDMNRDLSVATGPDGRAAVRSHVLGLYEVIDRLRDRFPLLEIETCASGGGRADLGILARTHRVWTSDCNDPVERQRIQHGFLHWFPPEVMGAHVSAATAHTTGRPASIAMRTLTALFGHFGIEADLLAMPEEDRRALRDAIAVYKAERGWLHDGDVTPIDPADPSVHAIWAVAADRSRALLAVAATERPRLAQMAAIALPELAPEARYRIALHPLWRPEPRAGKTQTFLHAGHDVVLDGRTLALAGITLPILDPASGALIVLNRVS